MNRPQSNIYNIPNALSLLRVGTIPFFIFILLKPDRNANLISALVFIIASFTDLADGYIARSKGQITNLGKFIDPLADKLMIITILILLIPLSRAPAWIVALITCRELAVTGLRAIAAERGIVIAARKQGKLKTAFQTLAVTALLLHDKWVSIDMQVLGTALLWLALVFTLWSGVDYFLMYDKIGRED